MFAPCNPEPAPNIGPAWLCFSQSSESSSGTTPPKSGTSGAPRCSVSGARPSWECRSLPERTPRSGACKPWLATCWSLPRFWPDQTSSRACKSASALPRQHEAGSRRKDPPALGAPGSLLRHACDGNRGLSPVGGSVPRSLLRRRARSPHLRRRRRRDRFLHV